MNIFVITVCYNAAATLANTLSAMEAQCDAWTHYFIIDGASGDNTLCLAKEFVKRHRGKVTVVSEPDSGIYEAMNKGVALALQKAGGEDLVAIVNADDYYAPEALLAMHKAATDNPDIDIFYGDCELLRPDGSELHLLRTSVSPLNKMSAKSGMPVEHPTMFIRARIYRALGLYNQTYRIAADYEFVLRVLDAGSATLHVGRSVTCFREGGVSTTLVDESLKEAIRARVAHGANPVSERCRYAKQKFNERLFSLLRFIPGVETAYNERYRSR